MAQKTWQFELEDGTHKVDLEHGVFSGKRNIRVDGNTILKSAELGHLVFDTGGVYEFDINSHPCAVIIRTNGITFNYDLAVDGRSVTTGQTVDIIRPQPTWFWILVVSSISLCVCLGAIVIPVVIFISR